ncbi:MAG TPA: IPT/TIG domain-containing protein, partial [Chloroflexota bacterium]
LDAGQPTERLGPLGFVWTWTVVPAVEAFHQWTFYADGLRPCITSGFNAFAPLGATPTPTETPQPTNTPGATATATPTPRPPQPSVTALSASSGECGSLLTITGTNFGATQADVSGQVFFSGPNGTTASNYLSWNSNQISVGVPSQLIQNQAYTVVVTHSGGSSQNPNAAAVFRAVGPGCAPPATATPTP